MRFWIGWPVAAVALFALVVVSLGTVGPMHVEDRNVPGATTGNGQSKLMESVGPAARRPAHAR